MSDQLEPLLQASSALHEEIDALWEDLPPTPSARATVVAGFCSIVRDQVIGQQYLLAVGLDVAAMTLVRPSFESLVRAIWALRGADDYWIQRFLTAPAPDADPRSETVLGPPVDSMLATIAKHHPAWVHGSLLALKEATWKPMHSYVHGGIRPVLQSLVGCPEGQQRAIVLNGNGFLMLATNALQIACGGQPGRLSAIQAEFGECLPPTSPVTTAATVPAVGE